MTKQTETETKEPRVRSVMYTQQIRLLKDKDWKRETKRIVNAVEPKYWASILHDKDVDDDGKPVEPHLHLMLYFSHARSPKSIAWEIDEKEGLRKNAKTERLEFFKNPNNGYSYLVHRTTNASDKYQYPLEDVFSNFDFTEKIEQITKNVTRKAQMKDSELINELLDLLYDGDITLKEVENILTGSQYAKAASRIKTVMLKRQEVLLESYIKEMTNNQLHKEIIYIYGKSGTGKTRLATNYANKTFHTYFTTGSSKDPFQDYQNEPIVIIDELRPETFSYDDLLKILDPYNFNVMVPVRFFDKALSAKMIFITSPYSPYELYSEILTKKKGNPRIDSFEQLERRIGLTLYIDKHYIYSSTFEPRTKTYIPIQDKKQKNPFYENPIYVHDEQKLFDKIIEPMKTKNV
ncbi:replication protein [Carnobacteriaceae bacterium zg-84]|uniref:Rep family protein n=1 Tax=Granulicatella sp. zg-84 TaxID=2678503 RepID=UPI0013C0886F|nr:Rep family protein [Granulicatella sp. zg-84]NEW66931.1 replication protein [Granulicatella sp. zg-84]QMI85892.1 replication protein [Carnobacteriaceae bacterium zg-84]